MLTFILLFAAAACAYVAWMLWEIEHAATYPEEGEKKHTETICGQCGGPDCIVGCDKPDADCNIGCDKSSCHTHKPEEITSASFIKLEKERIVTDDEIRYTAYLIASADNFAKNPAHYWIEAEKQLKENNHG
jgi:hypothetical protein